ncbi:MAG: hypothetical protein IPI30_09225 [Saprospiraceae bacterium]|nr:hypothetical protein [Candidatus Vicinibacter affinis]
MKKTNSNLRANLSGSLFGQGDYFIFFIGCTMDHINVIDDNNPASVTNIS